MCRLFNVRDDEIIVFIVFGNRFGNRNLTDCINLFLMEEKINSNGWFLSKKILIIKEKFFCWNSGLERNKT